ncbi:MAG: tyrosine-type recombinase/integrase [Synergistaceae bacterium]|nr:tyrosine-type recombinase/integrase [Synergistaceae bacterium]
MKQNALSDMIIRRAKPKDKRYMLTDGRGLKLEVMTTGTKYWRFLYRVQGRVKTLSIGEYPAVSLVEARQKTEELRSALKRGTDPRDVLNPPHKATFREVAEEWMMRQEGRWAESHAETVRHRLNNYLYPALGDRPIADIRAADVLSVLRALEARGLNETAKRTRQIFGQVARYGVAIEACETDVSAPLVDALAAPKVRHFAALTEKEDIRRLLLAMGEYRGFAVVIPAMWFSLYTLARPGEVRTAEWTEIDLDAAVWEIPAEKMKRRKPHAVPLSRQAVELLTEIKPLTGRGRYVFPSARNDGRPMSENAVRVALRSMGFSNDEMTAHGFRSLGSTMLNSLGYRPDVIEAALAHEQRGVRGVYNRGDYWEERVTMMQEWADWLDGLIQ